MPPTIVETKLEDILAKIDSRLERIENDLTDLKVNQVRMEEQLSAQINLVDEKLSAQINLVDEKLSAQINLVDEKLSGQISLVDEKVTGLGKRLDFQEFVNRGILTALIVTLIAGAAKFFGFMPNP